MRLWTIPGPGKLVPAEVATPVAGPGEIRLRVAAVGICGSDVEIFQGRRPPKVRHGLPVVGHAVSGTVDQVGPGVGGIRLGDRVSCVEGWGALTEHLVTTPTNSLVFDDRIPLVDGCLLEVLPGVAMAAWRTGIERNSDVLVVGQGVSGLLITRLVAVHGCRRLVVVDPDPAKGTLAREFGAHDVRTGTLAEVAGTLAADYPHGFDVAIAATPTGVVDEITPLMRPRSRIVAYGGLDDEARIDVLALHHRSVSLIKEGERIGGVREARAIWREALQLAYDGVLALGRLRTHAYPMEDAAAALRLRAETAGGIQVVLRNDWSVAVDEPEAAGVDHADRRAVPAA
ncbi:zinc-dependent alcohol dehydrogenase [Micromonospora sp. DT43]|uniref:zinc-dependent alcohol dehydrogenase n=1 Tax=Micromonospora sp. DT43 TaxID=3393440 RepID=UPI003CF70D66